MSNQIWTSIDPDNTSGVMLVELLTDFKDAVVSGFSGSSRPTTLQAGGYWVDTTNQTAPNYYWSFKVWNGTSDVEIFRLSILNGFGGTLTADGTFEIQEVADDTSGPILQLVKQRVANNGQLLAGDSVGEIRFTGRTNTGTDPLVAYLKFSASSDMTSSSSGGVLSLYSTPDSSSAISEHLRLSGGFVETVPTHKLNAVQPVSQNVATASTIVQLSASKVAVEMTGSTATDIQGINSGQDSKQVTIHNRSSANVTLKNQNASAASSDRISLPNSVDKIIYPNKSATLYYCSTDSRWKIKSSIGISKTRSIETFRGLINTWTAPVGAERARITAYSKRNFQFGTFSSVGDGLGNMYAWGQNSFGQLGLGDATPRSSAVAVLGGIKFNPSGVIGKYCGGGDVVSIGVDSTGKAYGWGLNTNGGLGVGDVTSRSSPTPVLGGIKFVAVGIGDFAAFGISENGSAYCWGDNVVGCLGVGDTTPRSSPVAVLGGLKFAKMAFGTRHAVGITPAGAAYSWGSNSNGELGVGDITHRSSPVAVLGGISFSKILLCGVQASVFGLGVNGSAYCWGNNLTGCLGVGDNSSRSSPVAVLGGLTFTDIFAGPTASSIYAITSDGTLYAWGDNFKGCLGVGDNVSRSSPVAVLGGIKFVDLVTEENSVLALGTDGVLYAWGDNTSGQLGLGNNVARSSPVAVLGGLSFVSMAMSFNDGQTAIGVTADGTLYAWGKNTSGDMGDGTVVGKSSPIAVLGGISSASDRIISQQTVPVTAGNSYSILLAETQSLFGDTPLGFNVDKITIEYEI